MKIILKTNWQIMHKPLIVCCVIPYAMTLVFAILCIVSPPRPEIRANPYSFPLFSLIISSLLTFFFYFIFISIRISCNKNKLTFYTFFLPVKSFPISELESVEYLVQTKYLLINRKYAFVCRLFPEKDIEKLLEFLKEKYGIKTGKI